MADLFGDALMLAIKIFAASLFTGVLCVFIVITAWIVVGFRNMARLEKEVKEAHTRQSGFVLNAITDDGKGKK